MPPLLTLAITPPEDGMTVKQLLREKLGFSMHQISRVKYRPEGFRVNGKPAFVNRVLRAGDELSFALDGPEGPSGSGIPLSGENGPAPESDPGVLPEAPRILYEDAFVLAADKPAGMVAHPSHGHHGDSAQDILARKYGKLYLIGRLDKDTSGVLLFAKDVETASLLSKQKESGLLYKTYLAAVSGTPDPPEGTVSVPIGTAREMPLMMRPDPQSGKEAATHYRTLRTFFDGVTDGPAALLSVRIEHGRTHQIRVHLSSIGCPLLGDRLYGNEKNTAARGAGAARPFAALHAAEVRFRHPYTGEPVRISTGREAPPGAELSIS